MFKFKKFCVWMVFLALILNFFIPLEVQAVTRSEAENFYDEFSEAIRYSNISKIESYFNKYSEDEIIKNFRIANIKYPKTSSYFFIARGCQEIGELENAYKYYSKAINAINSIKKADSKTKGIIYKFRAVCNFTIIKNINRYDEKKLNEVFDDFESSLKNNSKDYDTFYALGKVYYDLEKYEEALSYLNMAKYLCEDYETKNEIQEQIVYVQEDLNKNKPGILSWLKEHSGDLLNLGAALATLAATVMSGGGGGEQYQEGY